MKSDLKSYRVICENCSTVKKVAFSLMDKREVYIYCAKCHGSCLHRKVD